MYDTDEQEATLHGEFTLRIDLGNAAMSEVEHVIDALRATADTLSIATEGGEGSIHDANGNTVGRWKFALDT